MLDIWRHDIVRFDEAIFASQRRTAKRQTAKSVTLNLRDAGWTVEKGSKTPKFSPPRFGKALLGELSVARDPGMRLYIYQDGVYVPNDMTIERIITDALGDFWRPAHSTAIIEWLKVNSARLWDVDDHPSNVINVANGLLCLTDDGPVLRTHTRNHLSPVRIPVTYDAEARCPLTLRFLRQAIPWKSVRSVLLEGIGASLLVDGAYMRIFILFGPGGNGKSVLIRLWTALLGQQNVSAESLHRIVGNRFATANLLNKLLNTFADVSADDLKDTSILRAITGGDLVSGERKYEHSFSFVAFASHAFSNNIPPTIRDLSLGLKQRLIVIPMKKQFREGGRADEHLLSKLVAPDELSGLLNLAIKGYYRLREQGGYSMARQVDAERETWLRTVDTVLGWVRDEDPVGGVITAAAGGVPRERRSVMFDRYVVWCQGAKRPHLDRVAFHSKFREQLVEDKVLFREPTIDGVDHYHFSAAGE